uniref:Elongator complex protein 5 n=3 Tax=Lygus hesperus TaxID=30085 RepID=A0A0A9WNH0_LYGHE
MIFKQLLSGRQFSSFVLVKDNPNHSAHHVLRKIIGDNIERGNSVHLFNYESHNCSLYEDFMSNPAFRFHNCYHDNWDLKLVDFEPKNSSSWPSLISNKEGIFNVVVINSISHALEDLSLNSVCCQLKALKALNDENHRTQVIGIMNTSLTDDDTVAFKEINRLADSLITLGNLPNSSLLSVEHRKPFGKVLDGVYSISLDEETGFVFSEESKVVKGSVDVKPIESTPQVLTTFKLTLDDKEKESRRQVVLPYLKTAGSGKIIYEPDANDDWDDEDPDDDLEI